MQVAIAVDIGGTNTKLGLVTLEGTLLHRAGFSTQRYPRSDAFVLIVPALKAIKKHLYKTYPDSIQLLPSALEDNEISLLGAGALVWEQLGKEDNLLV